MSAGSLTKALETIRDKVADRDEFRRLYSNRKVHVFKISVDAVTKQCMIEIEARLLNDQVKLGTKKGKKQKAVSGGLLNKDGTLFVSEGEALQKEKLTDHPLFKVLKKVVDHEVPKMVKKMYDALSKGKTKTIEGDVVTLAGGKIGVRVIGNSKDFKATLSPIGKDKPDIFKNFKVNIKQKFQKDLYARLQKVINGYNKRTKANVKDIAGAGKSFLELGHDDGSAVVTQREGAVKDMFFEFQEGVKALEGDPDLQGMVKDFGDQFLFSILKKDSVELTTLSVSLESKLANANTVEKGEAGKDVLAGILEDAIQAAIKDGELKAAGLGGSDSRLDIIEKRILNQFEGKRNLKVNRRLPKQFKFSSGTPVKVKGKNNKATVFNETDTTKHVHKPFVKSKQKVKGKRGAAAVPLELLGIINQKLPQVVQQNMDAPALQNRTGRFASSVKVTDINRTAKGFPSIGYTYDRENYEQYEMTSGSSQWASADRDPRKLIDMSIREIAAQTAMGRFFTRRV